MLSSLTSFTTTSISGICQILEKDIVLSISDRNINASVSFGEVGSLNISMDNTTKRTNININSVELTPELIALIAALNLKFEEILLDIA